MLKRTRKNRFPAALVLFFVVFLCAIGFYLLYKNILFKKPFYISPIAGKVESPKDKIENLLIRENIPFTQVTGSESSYFVFLQNGGEVLLPLSDNIEERVRSLQLILKQFTIEGKKFKRIDFRFDKATILF